MVLCFLCLGAPKGSTGSGSGFKASQKMGSWLKVSSDRLGEPGIRRCQCKTQVLPNPVGGTFAQKCFEFGPVVKEEVPFKRVFNI